MTTDDEPTDPFASLNMESLRALIAKNRAEERECVLDQIEDYLRAHPLETDLGRTFRGGILTLIATLRTEGDP